MTHTASMRFERGASHQATDQPCGGDRHGGGHRGLQFCRSHGGHGHCRSKPDVLPSSRRLVHTEPQLRRLGMDDGSYGECTAKPGLLGFPNPGLTDVTLVRWCTAATNCTKIGNKDLALPSGYSRWMVFCPIAGSGCDTYNWLVGAVRTPNGPFTVMEGKYNGHPVKPSGTGAVESQGGPMFLYVGCWGRVGMVNGHTNGYVFGLRGHLDIPSCTRNPCPAVGL